MGVYISDPLLILSLRGEACAEINRIALRLMPASLFLGGADSAALLQAHTDKVKLADVASQTFWFMAFTDEWSCTWPSYTQLYRTTPASFCQIKAFMLSCQHWCFIAIFPQFLCQMSLMIAEDQAHSNPLIDMLLNIKQCWLHCCLFCFAVITLGLATSLLGVRVRVSLTKCLAKS